MNVTPDPAVGVKAVAWEPQAPSGHTPDDLTLYEWIGQAIGRASVCWVGGTGRLQFDSSSAQAVADGLHARVQYVIDEVIKGTTEAVQERHDLCGTCGEAFEGPEAAKVHVYQEHRGPNLGLASTEQMLRELACRFEVANLEMSEATVLDLIDGLSPESLAYKTVDSQ
jgi:hypothetical protein